MSTAILVNNNNYNYKNTNNNSVVVIGLMIIIVIIVITRVIRESGADLLQKEARLKFASSRVMV